MLKVCTSYSKKVPGSEQYSSEQFHASVELELSDALKPEELQERIHQTFGLVKSTVEEEISTLAGQAPSHRETRGNGTNGREGYRGRGDKPAGNVNGKATNAQIKYITSLATEKDIRLNELNSYVEDTYGVRTMYDLTKGDASKLVDDLKRGKVKIAA